MLKYIQNPIDLHSLVNKSSMVRILSILTWLINNHFHGPRARVRSTKMGLGGTF